MFVQSRCLVWPLTMQHLDTERIAFEGKVHRRLLGHVWLNVYIYTYLYNIVQYILYVYWYILYSENICIYIIRGSSSLYRAGVLHQTFGIFQSRSFGEMDPISIFIIEIAIMRSSGNPVFSWVSCVRSGRLQWSYLWFGLSCTSDPSFWTFLLKSMWTKNPSCFSYTWNWEFTNDWNPEVNKQNTRRF